MSVLSGNHAKSCCYFLFILSPSLPLPIVINIRGGNKITLLLHQFVEQHQTDLYLYCQPNKLPKSHSQFGMPKLLRVARDRQQVESMIGCRPLGPVLNVQS